MGRILFDTRTNEILWSQPDPKGNAYPANHKTLCKSAKVPLNEREFMQVAETKEQLFTKGAKRIYRIVNGKPELKPIISLKAGKQISLNKNPELTIYANIENVHTIEDIPDKLIISINGAEVKLRNLDSVYQETVEFETLGVYKIDVIEPNYKHNTLTVEVIA